MCSHKYIDTVSVCIFINTYFIDTVSVCICINTYFIDTVSVCIFINTTQFGTVVSAVDVKRAFHNRVGSIPGLGS